MKKLIMRNNHYQTEVSFIPKPLTGGVCIITREDETRIKREVGSIQYEEDFCGFMDCIDTVGFRIIGRRQNGELVIEVLR